MSCDMCSRCGGMASSVNYVKQIDPPINRYGTILGDSPQESNFRQPRSSMPSIQMCLPTLAGPPPPSTGHHSPGQQPSIIQVPCDPVKPCPRFICEPCPPPPPTKVWLIKSSPMPQKPGFLKLLERLLKAGLESVPCSFGRVSPLHSLLPAYQYATNLFLFPVETTIRRSVKDTESVCLPVGGSSNEGCSFSDKMMVCLPCTPVTTEPPKEKEKIEPVGLITRNKEMDLIGGKIVTKCTCGRKNGLAGEDCPRTSCQNNPGCTMVPPRCWPQFKLPEPPPPPLPDQDIICVPVQLVYYQPPPS